MVNNRLENKIIDNQKINAFNIFISRHREDFFCYLNYGLNNSVQFHTCSTRIFTVHIGRYHGRYPRKFIVNY